MSEQTHPTIETRETVWFTIEEYARLRKISISTVRRRIACGALPIERPSPRTVRIRLVRVVRSSQE